MNYKNTQNETHQTKLAVALVVEPGEEKCAGALQTEHKISLATNLINVMIKTPAA